MFNQITIHGYLGRDPEVTEETNQNGPYKKASFSVGVSRDYGDETDWFRCIMYGKRVDVLDKYFHKGSQIMIVGRMESYKPKNDPQRTAWILKVLGFDFCDKKGAEGKIEGQNETSGVIDDGFELTVDDDVPF